MTPAELALAARFAAAGLCVGVGALLTLTAALGLLRFPDFFSRMHAVQAGDAVAAGWFCAGLALVAWDGETTLRLALLSVLIAGLSPAGVHALAVAAHAGGLDPVIGRYQAPRPGAGQGGSA